MRTPFDAKLLQYVARQLQYLHIKQDHLVPPDLAGHIDNLWKMPDKHQEALTIRVAQIVSFDNDLIAYLSGFNPSDRTEHTPYFALQLLLTGRANDNVKLLTSIRFVPDIRNGLP